MADTDLDNLALVPGPISESTPSYYSNSSFVFANKLEVSFLFLRVPLASPDEIRKRVKDGKLAVPVVATVTMPRAVAEEVFETLGNLLKQTK